MTNTSLFLSIIAIAAAVIAASTTTILILGKLIADIHRASKRCQALQAHIDELVEDLDKTWAGT